MRILNAIHAQTIGGVDQVFRNYTEVLTQNNHEVALLISANGNQNYDAKRIFKLRNLSQIFDVIHLLIVVIRFRPDVIICHSRRLMKWMRFLPLFSSAKSIAVNHGITFSSSLNCHYVISINQEIADLVMQFGFPKERCFVLPNAIKVDQEYSKKEIKKTPTIGMYGRIEARKGFDVLIAAAGILAKEGYDFRLKIGGFAVSEGYDLTHLKTLAKEQGIFEKCDFVGTVYDKKSFFSDVDIFCVPSREEPFGIVILEGFLFSTLVISSNTDGGKFLVGNSENGLLFENENPSDLADKIKQVTEKAAPYQQLTKNAFLRLEKDFSFASLARQFQQILQIISEAK